MRPPAPGALALRTSEVTYPGAAEYVRQVEVEDNGGPWTPAIPNSTGHHGLDIVRALATRWGIEVDHAARTAWALFDWPVHP
jgi:hypothetical protein